MQEEVNILVYGVLQFSSALHHLYNFTAQKLNRIRRNLDVHKHGLGVLRRLTQSTKQNQKKITLAVENLKVTRLGVITITKSRRDIATAHTKRRWTTEESLASMSCGMNLSITAVVQNRGVPLPPDFIFDILNLAALCQRSPRQGHFSSLSLSRLQCHLCALSPSQAEDLLLRHQAQGNKEALDKVLVVHHNLVQRVKQLEETLSSMGVNRFQNKGWRLAALKVSHQLYTSGKGIPQLALTFCAFPL